jgi:hypothetical protein
VRLEVGCVTTPEVERAGLEMIAARHVDDTALRREHRAEERHGEGEVPEVVRANAIS